MFSQKKTILWIKQQEIIVTQVTEKGIAKHQESFAWDIQSLSDTLHSVKNKYKDIKTILVAPSFSYTVDIPTPPNSNREDIQKVAEEWIPEKLNDIPWSYVIVNDKLTVTALTSSFAEGLIAALHEINFGKTSVVSVEQLKQSPTDTVKDLSLAHWKRFIQLQENDKNLMKLRDKEKNKSPQKPLTSPSHSRAPRIIYLVIALLVSATIFVSFLLWKMESEEKPPTASPVSTKTQQSLAVMTITVSPSPSKDSYQIRILNGTGETGAAGLVEEILDAKGFKVVDTGNAERFDYQETEIRIKPTVPISFIDELDNILEDNYSVTRGSSLESGSEVDIIIITGLQK